MYVVTGGIYTDTDFKTLEPGTEETYGPFEDYKKALEVWGSRTWAKVDICCHRMQIIPQ